MKPTTTKAQTMADAFPLRGSPIDTPQQVYTLARKALEAVLDGTLPPDQGAAIAQLTNTLLSNTRHAPTSNSFGGYSVHKG